MITAMQPVIETPRLWLRRMSEADAPLILELNSDPEVLQYLHERPLVDEADAAGIIRTVVMPQYSLYDLGRLAVIEKASGDFLGWCGLKLRPELNYEVDLGYRLMKKYWGRGFASEAARACLHFGFTVKNLPEITGRAHIENAASLAVLKKIGLRYINNEVVDDCPVQTWRLTKAAYAVQALD